MINKHKSNKIKENSNTVRHWNNGTDHRHSKSCCDKSSPARRTITAILNLIQTELTTDKLIFPYCHTYASVNWFSIGADNGLPPIRRQAIIWTNSWLFSIGPLGTRFNEILIKIQNFSFTKMHLKISSAKRWPFCPGRYELRVRRCSWWEFPSSEWVALCLHATRLFHSPFAQP